MFERRTVDNTNEQGAVSVEIVLADGSAQTGRLAVPLSRSLLDVLNGPGVFLDFTPYEGTRRFLAREQIRSVRPIAVERGVSLEQRLRDLDDFDPHQILAIRPGADWEVVRQAYRDRARAYHPDLYASAELPGEVRSYLDAMARRINAAYQALEIARVAHKQAVEMRSTPVYTSARRS